MLEFRLDTSAEFQRFDVPASHTTETFFEKITRDGFAAAKRGRGRRAHGGGGGGCGAQIFRSARSALLEEPGASATGAQ